VKAKVFVGRPGWSIPRPEDCAASIPTPRGSRQCSNRGKHGPCVDGHRWCKTHAPEDVLAVERVTLYRASVDSKVRVTPVVLVVSPKTYKMSDGTTLKRAPIDATGDPDSRWAQGRWGPTAAIALERLVAAHEGKVRSAELRVHLTQGVLDLVKAALAEEAS
jgi:hypothetical protein